MEPLQELKKCEEKWKLNELSQNVKVSISCETVLHTQSDWYWLEKRVVFKKIVFIASMCICYIQNFKSTLKLMTILIKKIFNVMDKPYKNSVQISNYNNQVINNFIIIMQIMLVRT